MLFCWFFLGMDRNFHNTFGKKLDLCYVPLLGRNFRFRCISPSLNHDCPFVRISVLTCQLLTTQLFRTFSNHQKSSDSFQNSSVVGAQPPPCCSFPRHFVEKMSSKVIHCSLDHHKAQPSSCCFPPSSCHAWSLEQCSFSICYPGLSWVTPSPWFNII